MKISIFLLLVTILSFSEMGSAKAQLLNFNFTFSGDQTNEMGTVSGEIIGLEDNALNQEPQDIIIFSAPEVGVTSPISFAPFTSENFDFTVSGEKITGVASTDLSTGAAGVLELNLTQGGNDFGFNSYLSPYAYQSGRSYSITNDGGSGGVTYTYAGLTAPEPSSWALLLLGGCVLLLFMGFFRGRTCA